MRGRFSYLTISVLLSLLIASACSDTEQSNSASSWQLRPAAVETWLATRPHRLSIVFWPQLSLCGSCDATVSELLAEWQSQHDQFEVVSVVPPPLLSSEVEQVIAKLPGKIIRLDQNVFDRYASRSPRPRFEIWDSTGMLLMLRSLPNRGAETQLLTEEMLSAKSFTAPVEIPFSEK